MTMIDLKKYEACKYVRGIRNAEKRAYAEAYLDYLMVGGEEPPEPILGLSYMARQAVRLRLIDIWRK